MNAMLLDLCIFLVMLFHYRNIWHFPFGLFCYLSLVFLVLIYRLVWSQAYLRTSLVPLLLGLLLFQLLLILLSLWLSHRCKHNAMPSDLSKYSCYRNCLICLCNDVVMWSLIVFYSVSHWCSFFLKKILLW